MAMRASAVVFTPQLRASAAEFTPKPAEKGFALYCGFEDGCSTAMPSPALTFSDACSPWASPSLSPHAMAWCGPMELEQMFVEPEPLWLPDTEENQFNFELTGMQSFEYSLASLLAETPLEDGGLEVPPGLDEALSFGAPPGLAPPPGLELRGAGPKSAAPEKQLSVAELYAQMQSCATTDESEGTTTKSELEEQDEEAEAVTPSTASVAPVLSAKCTTVMLRNIPNKYNRDKLSAQLRTAGYGLEVDFIYMPIDFRNKCNVGYAFLNFRTHAACTRFAAEFHGQNSADKLPGFRSKKVCEVSEARYQGRQENVHRLQASQVMAELAGKPDWMPLLFDAEGKEEPFPEPKKQLAAAQKRPSVGRGGGRLSRKS